MKRKKFIVLTILTAFFITLQAPLPTSREGDFSDNLSPCKLIQANLLSKLVDIALYESTYKGGI